MAVLLPMLPVCARNANWFHADSSTVVSLLTCAPGSIIYELEGHAALRVRQADGTDITVNWGLFDFKSPTSSIGL